MIGSLGTPIKSVHMGLAIKVPPLRKFLKSKKLNIMNLYISLFLLSGFFSALNEAANLEMSAVQKLRNEMPIYAAIYDLDSNWDKNIPDNFKVILANDPNHINYHPFLRSPLHRAIEKMNIEAVEWLLDNNAFFYYGYSNEKVNENDEDKWVLLEPKKRGDKSPHLIGHLEEYFDPKKRDDAKTIVKHLYGKNFDIGSWPVKNEAFRDALKEVFDELNLSLEGLQEDNISGT